MDKERIVTGQVLKRMSLEAFPVKRRDYLGGKNDCNFAIDLHIMALFIIFAPDFKEIMRK